MCTSGGTATDADDNACAGGTMGPAAIGWNEDTKICTCFGEAFASNSATDYRRADVDDGDHGCVYCFGCVESVACGADGDVEVDVSQPGEVTFDKFDCDTDLDDAQAAIESALETAMCGAADDYGCGCEATVTKLTKEDCDDTGTDPTLTAEYTVTTVADLEDSNYHFAALFVDALGYYLAAVDDLSQTTFFDFVADVEAGVPGIFTAAPTLDTTLDDIESDILDEFKNWYPHWHGNGDKHTCKNDGQYPTYSEYSKRVRLVSPPFAATCLAHPPSLSTLSICAVAVTQSFFQPSLESCCDQYYGWAKTQCMIDGGANAAAYVTGHYYVDWESSSCKQDCVKDTPGKNCGGLKQGWQETYEDAEDCCNERLFWVNEKACVASSKGQAIADADLGSESYYVNWLTSTCVKDCVKNASSDADCGGLAKHWDEKYDSKSECCNERLWYVETDKC